jgi:CheY-like chemotaxis protein
MQHKTEDKGNEIDLNKKNNTVVNAFNLKQKRILVVNVILKEYNVLLSEANDGEEAVHHLKNNTCDLVLMDLQMPVLNGYQASEIIRQKLKLDMPIIALTASDTEEERQKCLEVGMNDYLSKPFNEEQLIQIICRWIVI